MCPKDRKKHFLQRLSLPMKKMWFLFNYYIGTVLVTVVLLLLVGLFMIHIVPLFLSIHKEIVVPNQSDIWTAIGAIGTIGAIAFAVVANQIENNKRRKENTLNAYPILKEKFFDFEKELDKHNEEFFPTLVQNHSDKKESEADAAMWNDLKLYLTAIERFAVGVNSKIYDIKIVNRMGGKYLVNKFNKLSPVIKYKRGNNENRNAPNPHVYEEFEKMAKDICRLRGEPWVD